MDNQNDLQEWNIRPEQRGGGDGRKWNYAVLVPLLGLAAYRWIWGRESQKELQKVKIKYEDQIVSVQAELKKLQDENQSLRVKNALAVLDVVEGNLLSRQEIFCSYFRQHQYREEIEKNIWDRVEREKEFLAGLNIERDLRDIFKKETCAEFLNTDRRKNSTLIETYLKLWRNHVSENKPGSI